MARRGVEIPIELLHVLAVVALAVGQAKEPLLQNWILAVPERQCEAEQLVLVGKTGLESGRRNVNRGGAPTETMISPGGRPDIGFVLDYLARERDVQSLLVEGGATIHGAFIKSGLVDRVAVFVAPKLLGGATAPGPAGGPGLLLPDAVRLGRLTARPIGDDWLLEGTVER